MALAVSGGGSLRRVPSYLHTCYRIGDIDRSVAFYEKLGFQEVARMPIGDEAINVFMGLPGEDPRLELTYNHGVDSYELGTGYNHIAIAVDDLEDTLARSAAEGIEPEKPPVPARRPHRGPDDLLRPRSGRLPDRADRGRSSSSSKFAEGMPALSSDGMLRLDVRCGPLAAVAAPRWRRRLGHGGDRGTEPGAGIVYSAAPGERTTSSCARPLSDDVPGTVVEQGAPLS